MTNVLLHVPARPGAPVACDMSSAPDTPDERLSAYGRLFEHALARRERREGAVVFWFRGDPETRATVEELARREAACCPFLDHRVETAGDELRWTTTNSSTGDARGSADAILDAFYALPDHPGSGFAGLLSRLSPRR